MIYTIGYQKLSPEALAHVMEVLEIKLLIDCRAVPQSRKPGWSRKRLEERFGEKYSWFGDHLGGRRDNDETQVTALGLEKLTKMGADADVVIMCMEEAPSECHRHFDIGLPLAKLGVPVRHVYHDELIDPIELQRSEDDDDDYDCETVDDLAL